MKVSNVVELLERIAPPDLAADWDNVGLLAGDLRSAVRRIMLCVDLTEPVLAEAIAKRAQMVVAYHPVIFKPISRIGPAGSPVVYQAVRRGLAIYSVHTALDAAPGGTDDVLADILGLADRRPIEPTNGQDRCKVVVFVPPADLTRVSRAAFAAGAGVIGNYYDCAFFGHGIGTFCGGAGSHPAVGRSGRHEATEEIRLEFVAPRAKAHEVCSAVRSAHSYEEPAIDVYPLLGCPQEAGFGRIGRLARPVRANVLISRIKKKIGLKKVLLVSPPRRTKPAQGAGGGDGLIRVAACSAGSAGGRYRLAVAGGATFYLTGELRHHDALAAGSAGLTVVAVGHSHSERIALGGVRRRLLAGGAKIEVLLSAADCDPFEIV